VTVRALSSLEAAKLSLDSAESSMNEFGKNSKTLSAKHAARYKAGYDVLKSICGILDIVGPFIACEVSTSRIRQKTDSSSCTISARTHLFRRRSDRARRR
jgi:hypothetical protein